MTRFPSSSAPRPHPALAAALKDCRRAFRSVALFSAVVNILMLAGPLYMLQVYDRVLASHSVATLIALSALLCGALALQAAMELIRGRIVTRSARFSTNTCPPQCIWRLFGFPLPAGRPARPKSRFATSITSGLFSPGRARSPSSICLGSRCFC